MLITIGAETFNTPDLYIPISKKVASVMRVS